MRKGEVEEGETTKLQKSPLPRISSQPLAGIPADAGPSSDFLDDYARSIVIFIVTMTSRFIDFCPSYGGIGVLDRAALQAQFSGRRAELNIDESP